MARLYFREQVPGRQVIRKLAPPLLVIAGLATFLILHGPL
jgi:hypothetical protein